MPDASRVFVVHVWAENCAFKARARAADAEQPCDFDDPQALVDYLHHGADAPCVTVTTATTATPPAAQLTATRSSP